MAKKRKKQANKRRSSKKLVPKKFSFFVKNVVSISIFLLGVAVTAVINKSVDNSFVSKEDEEIRDEFSAILASVRGEHEEKKSMLIMQQMLDLNKKVSRLNSLVKDFDRGREEAAIKMSLILRGILFGDGIRRPLIEVLNMKNKIRYVDSSTDPETLSDRTIWRSPFLGIMYLDMKGGSTGYMKYVAKIEKGFIKRRTNFQIWSQKTILDNYKGISANRKGIVLAVALLEGSLPSKTFFPKKYKELAYSNFTGWSMVNAVTKYRKDMTDNRADFVAIRAIAEEFILSFYEYTQKVGPE
ncbi:hypothetical protein [Halobacteriovorax sp. DA5]|uniref:hypothetical protein n=1 Tax=Halobacteriovorax sp. DA5 TaxID=2067553 RepID=UPI000CD0F373|nr:hypothetical protein [Halobacteriovorax sp. DA5]POB15138.1 hypothetical protein C0Z22_01790 [Halobacteriovorax sp. DA5]